MGERQESGGAGKRSERRERTGGRGGEREREKGVKEIIEMRFL